MTEFDENGYPIVPWVICDGGLYDWKCTRCGRTYFPKIAEGQPIWVLTGLLWGFMMEHRNCEEEDSEPHLPNLVGDNI